MSLNFTVYNSNCNRCFNTPVVWIQMYEIIHGILKLIKKLIINSIFSPWLKNTHNKDT